MQEAVLPWLIGEADDNHKPEMTIAVTPFDGLCGFRPLNEIVYFLKTVQPLRKLVGDREAQEFEDAIKGHTESDSDEVTQSNKKALQKAFTALMNSDKTAIAELAKELIAVAEREGDDFAGGGGPANSGKEWADLIVRLNGQFPGDIGLFVLFFLNYVRLDVGEAMFLKADDIHAYLSGGNISHCINSLADTKNTQISSSAWPHRTMSCGRVLRPNSRMSILSRLC